MFHIANVAHGGDDGAREVERRLHLVDNYVATVVMIIKTGYYIRRAACRSKQGCLFYGKTLKKLKMACKLGEEAAAEMQAYLIKYVMSA